MSVTTVVCAAAEPAQRGRELGRAAGPQIAATFEEYLRFFADHGLTESVPREVGMGTLELVADWAPAQAEEMAGIADGAGLEPWQVGALNARSEILARYRPSLPGECSTAVFLPAAGPARTIQTWDWYEQMQAVALVWQYPATAHRTVTTMTEFGILAKIGVTSTGLALHFNLLQHDADGGRLGIPVHLIARRILDEAVDLDHAEQIARSAAVSASVSLTVVAHDGDRSRGCVLECSPAGTARIEPAANRFLLHTNHFLDPGLAAGDRLLRLDPDTAARLSALQERTTVLAATEVGERAEAFVHHREQGAALCCHPYGDDPVEGRWQTLVTVALEPDSGRLVHQGGLPCRLAADAWVSA